MTDAALVDAFVTLWEIEEGLVAIGAELDQARAEVRERLA